MFIQCWTLLQNFRHRPLENVLFLKVGFKRKAPIDLAITMEGVANVIQNVVELLDRWTI